MLSADRVDRSRSGGFQRSVRSADLGWARILTSRLDTLACKARITLNHDWNTTDCALISKPHGCLK